VTVKSADSDAEIVTALPGKGGESIKAPVFLNIGDNIVEMRSGAFRETKGAT
jgi:hypothetical protein